jgi:heme-degrading monooxygenase HmoA
MLLERSELTIREGQEEAFAAVMREEALGKLRAFPGVRSAGLGRGVENPDKFILLVEWENMDAHTAFKASDVYLPFVQLFAPFSKGGAMEHFEMD